MWTLALSSLEAFEKLHAEFSTRGTYVRSLTGTGAEVSSPPEGSGLPSLIFFSGESLQFRQIISWAHKTWFPSTLIATGLAEDCVPTSQASPFLFTPATCLRSAGRLDFAMDPVLYEEISFSPEIQRILSSSLNQDPAGLAKHQLFTSPRVLKKDSDREWVFENLKCQSWDQQSGELLLASQRLGLSCGCFYVLKSASEPLETLVESWRSLLRTLGF